jgi:SAM-dependent methyltransferase
VVLGREEEQSSYGKQWDSYVENWETLRPDDNLAYPGDEWGFEDMWEKLFEMLFLPAGVQAWERAVEIGPGSGKYTEKVLERSDALVRAYDVSPKFLEVCRDRCASYESRLALTHLELTRPDELLIDLADWRGTVDGFFSIDAMVHVDFQYVIAYLITAAAVLKPRGKLLMTFANAASEKGFEKVIEAIPITWKEQWGERSGKFEWLSPDILDGTLTRLGFDLDRFDVSENSHYINVVATLVRPEDVEKAKSFL